MALAAGSRLGSYEILGLLGAGGMGEVYRARDTRLDRTVAVKVLAPHLAERPDFRDRFEREAKTISALNHPNICIVHDVGVHDGHYFLVLELLEGESLAARLERGAMSADALFQCAIQVADALAAAHAHDVVHRDLKPANIMLTKSGAKLLDFGLAKLKTTGPVSPNSQQPTNVTAEGAILGTVQYMSPEQLEGLDADSRSDIFSFGATLYEMASGRRAFEGRSQASLISEIMKSDPPPLNPAQHLLPKVVDRIVRKCLEKDPTRRWQNAADLANAIRLIADPEQMSATAAAAPAAPPRKRSGSLVVAGAALFLIGAALGAAAFLLSNTAKPLPVRIWEINLDQEDYKLHPFAPAISPDGGYIAFTNNNKLWIRNLSEHDSQEIANTRGAEFPFWSPDGQSIGFGIGGTGTLWKTNLRGAVSKIVDLPPGYFFGASWGPGTILVNLAAGPGSGQLYSVSEQGGVAPSPVRLGSTNTPEAIFDPVFLPDGKSFFVRLEDKPTIHFNEQNKALPITGFDNNVVFLNGYVIFDVRGNGIKAAPFSTSSMEMSGTPFQVAAKGSMPSASNDGTLAYLGPTTGGAEQLVWVDRAGRTEASIGEPLESIDGLRISPDGQRVAVSATEQGNSNLWIQEIQRGARTRLSQDELTAGPIWSPNGDRIAYGAGWDTFVRASDGSGDAKAVVQGALAEGPFDWSRDGAYLLFMRFAEKTQSDIWYLSMADGGQEKPFLVGPGVQDEAQLSPDGRFIAYRSTESGRSEIYIKSFPDGAGRAQVSVKGGEFPRWTGKGDELFFFESSTLMAVSIETRPTLRPGIPHALFTAQQAGVKPGIIDITSDGRRFMMVKPLRPSHSSIVVIQNWLAAVNNKDAKR